MNISRFGAIALLLSALLPLGPAFAGIDEDGPMHRPPDLFPSSGGSSCGSACTAPAMSSLQAALQSVRNLARRAGIATPVTRYSNGTTVVGNAVYNRSGSFVGYTGGFGGTYDPVSGGYPRSN